MDVEMDRERDVVVGRRRLHYLNLLLEENEAVPSREDAERVLAEAAAENLRRQQITRDLASFWKNTYPEIKKELSGRYPKHAWPEDPWNAVAQRRPQRRPKS